MIKKEIIKNIMFSLDLLKPPIQYK
jgi:hypothetical protein